MKTLVSFRGCQNAITRSFLGAVIAAAVLNLGAVSSHATALGVSTDPMGSSWIRGDANSGYAVWDTFAGTGFSGIAPGTSFATLAPGSSSGITFPNVSQLTPYTSATFGAGLYDVVTSTPTTTGPGDILFTGNQQTNFKITGALGFTIHGLSLQIKRAGSQGGMSGSGGFTPSLTINGGASILADWFVTTFGTGDTNSSGASAGQWSVTTWYWSSSLVGNTATGTNNVQIALSNTLTRSIDGFAIDAGSVVVVPEPSTWAMLIIGGIFGLGHAARARRSPLS